MISVSFFLPSPTPAFSSCVSKQRLLLISIGLLLLVDYIISEELQDTQIITSPLVKTELKMQLFQVCSYHPFHSSSSSSLQLLVLYTCATQDLGALWVRLVRRKNTQKFNWDTRGLETEPLCLYRKLQSSACCSQGLPSLSHSQDGSLDSWGWNWQKGFYLLQEM